MPARRRPEGKKRDGEGKRTMWRFGKGTTRNWHAFGVVRAPGVAPPPICAPGRPFPYSVRRQRRTSRSPRSGVPGAREPDKLDLIWRAKTSGFELGAQANLGAVCGRTPARRRKETRGAGIRRPTGTPQLRRAAEILGKRSSGGALGGDPKGPEHAAKESRQSAGPAHQRPVAGIGKACWAVWTDVMRGSQKAGGGAVIGPRPWLP